MPIRLAFLMPNARNSFGGMERVISTLSKYFYERGYQVDLIFLDKKFLYNCDTKIIELKIKIAPTLFSKVINLLKRAYKLNEIFKIKKYDVIISMYWLAPLLAFIYRKKIINCYHSDPFYLNFLFRHFLKISFKLSSKVVVPSKAIADKVIDKWRINKIVAIPNPLDQNYILSNITEVTDDLILKNQYIVSVGRLVKEKNFELLINAFTISKSSEFMPLIIIGDGYLSEHLGFLIKEKLIGDKIILLGKLDNPFTYIYNSLFLVISSDTEVFPMVCLEALTCGVPVISTNWFGSNLLIKDGKNGILVEKDNHVKLSKAIDRLYFDIHLRKKLKKNSKGTTVDFSLERVGKQYEDIFNEICSSIS